MASISRFYKAARTRNECIRTRPLKEGRGGSPVSSSTTSQLCCVRRENKPGKKGYPKFKKHSRSVEYKKSGWKLDPTTKKHIVFTDKNNIGRLKLVGSRNIYFYQPEQIKRVRLVRRADGYYIQFCVSIEVKEEVEPSGRAIGLDMGLRYFFSDSFGNTEANPRFY